MGRVMKNKRVVTIAIVVIIVVFVLHFINPASYFLADDGRVKEDLTCLNKKIAALDSEKIDSEISRAAFSVKLNEVGGNEGQLDNRFVFSKSVLIGDSMAESVVDYRILDSTNVFAVRGKQLISADDLIAKAISARPENLFIEFGMNDITSYRGKVEPFIDKYKEVVQKFKAELPNTKLYIVSICTISPQGIEEDPTMRNYPEYNRAMKEMCRQENMTYIDTTMLIDSSSEYEFDGVHPKEPYYSNWVKLMCSYILESNEV